jgi:hypothetical protein
MPQASLPRMEPPPGFWYDRRQWLRPVVPPDTQMARAWVAGPGPHGDEAAADERAVLLVGRDEELGLLRRRWEQSKEGLG